MPTVLDVQSGDANTGTADQSSETVQDEHEQQTEEEPFVQIAAGTRNTRHIIRTKDVRVNSSVDEQISNSEKRNELPSIVKTENELLKQDKGKLKQKKNNGSFDAENTVTSDASPANNNERSHTDATDQAKSDGTVTPTECEAKTSNSETPAKPIPSAKKEVKKRKSPKKNKEATSRKRNVKASVKSHLLTEFYPVRRSLRKPKSVLEKEQENFLMDAIEAKCEDGLEVVEFEGKGRGVIAKRAFKKGSFVVEYAGDLIDWTEAKKREVEYAKDTSVGCYMYYFVFDNINYCVDATSESGRFGRLLNHSRKNPNCKTKLVRVSNQKEGGTMPRLVIVAKQDIGAGEELTYDYGDRDKETLQSHPWLKST